MKVAKKMRLLRKKTVCLLILTIIPAAAVAAAVYKKSCARITMAGIEHPDMIEKAKIESIMNRLPDSPLSLWEIIRKKPELRKYAIDKFMIRASKPDPVKPVRDKLALPGFLEFCKEIEKGDDGELLVYILAIVSRHILVNDDILEYWRSLLAHDSRTIRYLALYLLEKIDPSIMEAFLADQPYEDVPLALRHVFLKNPYLTEIRNKRYDLELERYLLDYEAQKSDGAPGAEVTRLMVHMIKSAVYTYDDVYYKLDKPEIFKLYEKGMEILEKHGIDSLTSGLPDAIALSFYCKPDAIELVISRFLENPTDHNRMAVLLALHSSDLNRLIIPDGWEQMRVIAKLLDPELPAGVKAATFDEYQSFYHVNDAEILRKCKKHFEMLFRPRDDDYLQYTEEEKLFLRHIPQRIL